VQGTFTPLAPQLSSLLSNLVTDDAGRFKEAKAALGTYTWNASSSCVDRVTNLPLTYNWQLVSPVRDLLIVTDLTLLTTPASAGLKPLEKGSSRVYQEVYGAFGLDTAKLQVGAASTGRRKGVQRACICGGAGGVGWGVGGGREWVRGVGLCWLC